MLDVEQRALSKIIESCLIFLLIFTPLALGTVQPWSIFIMRMVVVVALVCWAGKIIIQKDFSFHSTPLDIPILVFLAIAGASTLFISPYKHKSLDWFTNLLTYTAVYFILVNNIKNEPQIKRLIGAMLTAGSIVGVYGVLRYFNVLDVLPHSEDPRISSAYYHASHYAGFLVMVTPLAIGYFLFSKSLWKTLAFGALSAVLIVNLALSFSITNLAFVISMIFLVIVIFCLREWKIIMKKLVPSIGIFFLFYILVLVITSPFLSQYTIPVRFGQVANTLKSAIDGRIRIWRDGFSVVMPHLYSGWGLGLFSDIFPKFRPPHWTIFLNYAHSDYLQIASDMGMIGLGVYLFLIGMVLKESTPLLKQRRYNQGIAVGIVVALLAAIVRSLWDSNLFIVQSLSIYLFTLTGLLIVLRKKKERKP